MLDTHILYEYIWKFLEELELEESVKILVTTIKKSTTQFSFSHFGTRIFDVLPGNIIFFTGGVDSFKNLFYVYPWTVGDEQHPYIIDQIY